MRCSQRSEAAGHWASSPGRWAERCSRSHPAWRWFGASTPPAIWVCSRKSGCCHGDLYICVDQTWVLTDKHVQPSLILVIFIYFPLTVCPVENTPLQHNLIMLMHVKLRCRNVYHQSLPALFQMKYQWAAANNRRSKPIKLNLEEWSPPT